MNIAEKPIAAIIGRLTSTGDGIHMIANGYRKGHRIGTHMHREAQLVYAAKGTMQVTTDFKDYKEYDGILFPQVIEQNIGVNVSFKARVIEVNKPMDESVFLITE